MYDEPLAKDNQLKSFVKFVLFSRKLAFVVGSFKRSITYIHFIPTSVQFLNKRRFSPCSLVTLPIFFANDQFYIW